MEHLVTPPPRPKQDSKSKAEIAANELLAHNLNVIASTLTKHMEITNQELSGLRRDMREEREQRRKEGLSAKLWTGTLVAFATILGNIFLKLLL